MTTTQQPLPGWLVDKLDNEGTLDAATRLTSRPRIRRCPRGCGAPVLAALDDILGQPTYATPDPTTPIGEVAAVLTGIRTFTVVEGELVDRDAWRISHRDADTEPAHPEHACHSPPYPTSDRHTGRRRRPVDYDQPPPF